MPSVVLPSAVPSSVVLSNVAMPGARAVPAPETSVPKTWRRLAAVGLLSLSLGGCIGYDGDVQHGYQLDPQAMADVKPGQTAEQVLVTMGTPSTTSTVGGSAWYYIQQKTEKSIAFMRPKVTDQRVYAIYFDKQKRVTHVANYGMQDGRVVDFANGATPTVGADNNFLKGIFFNFNPLQSMMQNG